MNELLELAVKAHGGLARWNEVSSVEIDVSITGAIWYVKGQPDVLKNIVMVADTHQERVTTSFVAQDRRTIFETERVVVEAADGRIEEVRNDPEASFAGQTTGAPWDAVQVAYFSGEALWTYLNTPFLYIQDRFATEEIGSIHVDGETWRRLRVIFPDEVKSHTRGQFFCFGRRPSASSRLHRRHPGWSVRPELRVGVSRTSTDSCSPPNGASPLTKAITGLFPSPFLSRST